MSRLKHFLTRARALPLHDPSTGSSMHLVMGNEASDADSIVSAMLHSYFLHCTHNTNATACEFIPIVCSPRKDMPLKRDTEVLLSTVGLGLSDVLCIDELVKAYTSACFDVTLTDHNEISKSVEDAYQVKFNVQGILDHHQDEGGYLSLPSELREVAFDNEQQRPLVGSTCTLVAERFLRSASEFLDSDLCTLLLGVIAVDTRNLDPEADRGTQRDAAVLDALQRLVPGVDRSALFERVSSAKSERSFWMSMSAANAMRVDYKVFTSDDSRQNFGIATVNLEMRDVLEKDDLVPAVKEHLNDHGLAFIAVMGVTFDPLQRELLICAAPSVASTVEAFLASSSVSDDLRLELEVRKEVSGITLLAFKQLNIKLSRKQVAPILQKMQLL